MLSDLENEFAVMDAEDFIDDNNGDISAISAEIDHSQTRRETARQHGHDATVAYERVYERRLRREIQVD